MNEELAKRLIEQTFNAPFQQEQFERFTKNLLNEIDDSSEKRFSYSGNLIKDAYQNDVNQYQRVGTYTTPEDEQVDILIVKLKTSSKLDRARTMQRNFVAHYLKDRDDKNAALVAYYSEDSATWRFSYVKMEYELAKTEKGFDAKEKLTPARRFSFLVGENEPNHTAKQQLLPILQDTRNPSLSALEEAFNIESVTKEFFGKYKELFLNLKEELDVILDRNPRVKQDFAEREIDTANFAKKLLGQIVFLYFLQKKGWLGVDRDNQWGSGDKDFLLNQFKSGNYTNYFQDVLEPLFYEALAIKREDSGNFYAKLYCRIPFLNGGLFEPMNGYNWQADDLPISNEFFYNGEEKGLFGIFGLYNFTVREDEPMDKEVAVDPEMLGKVFENLLEVTDRKSKGAFYTPREIVTYMCQESLINYLDTAVNQEEESLVDEKPEQVDMFSGAPPKQETLKVTKQNLNIPKEDLGQFIRYSELVGEHEQAVSDKGQETETYSFVIPASIRENAEALDTALADVKICDPAVGSGAFPVGMMQEIVRARKALTAYLKPSQQRAAYKFKWHCIENSLYGVDIDPGAIDVAKLRLWLSLIVDEDDYDDIRPLPNLDYKMVRGNSLLGAIRQRSLFDWKKYLELENKKSQYFISTNKQNKDVLKKEIDGLVYELLGQYGFFDFDISFSEVMKGNGGFDIVIGNPPYGISITGEKRKKYLESLGKVPDYEIYYFFIQLARKLLKNNGVNSLIIPNTFLFNVYAKKFRKALLNFWKIHQIIDCSAFKIFESATVFNAIIVFEKAENPRNHVGYKNTLNANSFFELSQMTTSYMPRNTLLANNKNWGLAFKLPEEILNTTSKIKSSPIALEDLFPGISQGLIAYDKYRGQSEDIIKNRAYHFNEKVKPNLKEWLWGQDVTPYKVLWNEQEYIEYCEGIANPRNPKFFRGSRVLVREITNPKIYAGYTNKEQYHDPAIIVILDNGNGILPLMGILNSKLATFYHFNSSPKATKGAFPKILVKDIKEFPLPTWSEAQILTPIIKQIIERTMRPLKSNIASGQINISSLHDKVDEIVYNLYGLSEEEIRLVEVDFEQRNK